MMSSSKGTLEVEKSFSTWIELLNNRAENQPNQTAYTFLKDGEIESNTLTYQELCLQSKALGAYLQSLGIGNEPVLLVYPAGLDFITAFFGCLYGGAIAVPAYTPRKNQHLARLISIIENSQAKVVLTTTSILSNIKQWFEQNPQLGAIRWLTTDNIDISLAADWREPALISDSVAFLQYTSGSTGTPKGVTITHQNLLHNSSLIYQHFEHNSESRGVIWLPPYHDMGLIGGVLQPLYGGFPVTLMSPIDFLKHPINWLKAISRYQATTSGGPNFAYDLVCRKITPEHLSQLDLSHWEVAFTGAEPIRAETLEQFATTFEPCGFRKEAFYPCYGMAETTLFVTGGRKKDYPVIQQFDRIALQQNQAVATQKGDNMALVGCGQSSSDQTVIIVNPESLEPCQDNQIGEVWVSGKSIAQGYWNQPEETKKTFQAYLSTMPEKSFFRTGDLGFMQNAELFITGRLKDIIIIRGQNYYPHDIELTVEKSHPSLRAGCGAAFSVDFKGSERLVIIQEVERSYLRKLNQTEVVNKIRQAITAEHDLQVYAIVLLKPGSIPKTSSGKIRRSACRAAFLSASLEVVGVGSENPQGKAKFMHLQSEIDSLALQVKQRQKTAKLEFRE